MGQNWVLQAWETAGFCSTEQPTAGRPPARHCTDRVCTPPPQRAVHCGRHEPPSGWATRQSRHPFLWVDPSSQAPQGGLSLSQRGGGLNTSCMFPRCGHWEDGPRSLSIPESSRARWTHKKRHISGGTGCGSVMRRPCKPAFLVLLTRKSLTSQSPHRGAMTLTSPDPKFCRDSRCLGVAAPSLERRVPTLRPRTARLRAQRSHGEGARSGWSSLASQACTPEATAVGPRQEAGRGMSDRRWKGPESAAMNLPRKQAAPSLDRVPSSSWHCSHKATCSRKLLSGRVAPAERWGQRTIWRSWCAVGCVKQSR